MTQVTERLAALRTMMRQENVAACLVTNYDPHHSEYSGTHWLAREYLSGFTGSAGDLLVLADSGGLWTDGRYAIQAAEQLAGTDIDLFMSRSEESPSIAEHLLAKLDDGAVVAVAGHTINTTTFRELSAALAAANITLRTDLDLPDQVWHERPPRSSSPAFDYPLEFAGQNAAEKLQALRTALAKQQLDAIAISALPDICWLLNIRGRDVPYCPLVECYFYATADQAVLCIDAAKCPSELRARLSDDGVTLAPYDDIEKLVGTGRGRISLCPFATNSRIYRAAESATDIVLEPTPTQLQKAQKNPTELAAFRETLKQDGVAMVRFARWLELNVGDGKVSELVAETVLREMRAELPHFIEESFHTIAGYGPHAALMHYAATEDSNASIEADALFLVDSGGQYLGGTTDITRTFAFGDVNPQQRMDYTRVLQAVIRLSQTRFRKGASGCNLDIMARGVLWQHGIDYESGTGHGVGQCLVVHEGPQLLSQRLLDAPLLPGMSITNEPGIYRAGRHGVRIENILCVVEAQETEFGIFYAFETLTLAPIQTRALNIDALSSEERQWLNEYHERVLTELSPLLEDGDREWLIQACEPI